jgi:hypothetical protein
MSNQNAEFASLLKKTPLQLKCQIDPVSILKVKVYFHHANHDHKAELPINSMEDAKTILYSQSVNFRALLSATILMAGIPLHTTMKCSLEQPAEVGMPP